MNFHDGEADRVLVPVSIDGQTKFHIEITSLGEEQQEVGAFDSLEFRKLTDSIEGIAGAISTSIKKLKPQKATVEFGIEVGIESGQLTALICKGSGKANLKVTLEWSEDKP